MSSEKLTDKQELFVEYYCRNPNATNAARLAGYAGNDITLAGVGYELLRIPHVRAVIDQRLQERILGKGDLLALLSNTANMDVTPYVRDDGTLDVSALSAAGLGHLVKGIKPSKDGTEVTLVDPQTARKTLARYHRILGSLEVDLTTTSKLDRSSLDVLVAQVTAAARQGAQETDDTTEQSDIE